MRNVECGMQNISTSVVRQDLALQFRIPHSAFRIGVIPHFAFV